MFEVESIIVDHKDVIHDVVFDYYGRRMATCSSDQTVKVCFFICYLGFCLPFIVFVHIVYFFNHPFQIWDENEQGEWAVTSSWKAHSGSIWRVSWAHPEFGQVLATCSFDRTASVWEEVLGEKVGGTMTPARRWVKRTILVDSRTSVTDVEFAPKYLGLLLATASADGVIRIYEAPDIMNLSQWSVQHEITNKLPLSCLSWNTSMYMLSSQLLAVSFCYCFAILFDCMILFLSKCRLAATKQPQLPVRCSFLPIVKMPGNVLRSIQLMTLLIQSLIWHSLPMQAEVSICQLQPVKTCILLISEGQGKLQQVVIVSYLQVLLVIEPKAYCYGYQHSSHSLLPFWDLSKLVIYNFLFIYLLKVNKTFSVSKIDFQASH